MAGIGFELKKMFQKKGLLSVLKAYGYAGIVCTGPMILGVLLLLGIRWLGNMAGASENDLKILNVMVTYTLLISLVLTNIFSLVTTRFTADQLYEEKGQMIMPSFWGSISIMLGIGIPIYGIFLYFSGIDRVEQFLCILFMGELILVWTQINYLTAIKDYQGIMVTFALSISFALMFGYFLSSVMQFHIIYSLMIAVCIAYGIMAIWYQKLLLSYFPKGKSSAFYFLRWFNKYMALSPLGISLALGLFGHLVIMWTSSVRHQVIGLFYEAPVYDISALLAFLSILITTINFVTSVEVNFYPKYRNYFSLFNDGGSLNDIEQAEKEMKMILAQELAYTFTKQFFVTIIFIVAGSMIFPYLPLGMTEDMLGIYRVLCVGYAFYAVGNCVMLIQLYFADNKGAFISGFLFMLVSCFGSVITSRMDIRYYGVGFLAGSVVFALVSLFLLWRYLRKIMENILCNQPIVAKEFHGLCYRISEYAEGRYQKRYPELRLEEDWKEDND